LSKNREISPGKKNIEIRVSESKPTIFFGLNTANMRLTPKGEGSGVTLAWLVSRSELGVDYLRKAVFFIIFIKYILKLHAFPKWLCEKLRSRRVVV
jgi:hypothetical protein